MFLSNNKENQIKEILEATGLDFKIFKEAMTAQFNGQIIDTPYHALIHGTTGEVINSVKKGYHVTQNEDIVGLVLDGMSQFGTKLSVQKGGSLKGGRRVYLQLAIEGDAKVGKDTLKKYITIIDSNDGSASLSVGIGDLTMSCSNQFFQFSKANQSRFKHTASMVQRVKELPFLIESAMADSYRMIETYNSFQSNACSRSLVDSLVNEMLGHDKASMTHLEYANMNARAEANMNALYSHIEKEINCKGLNMWGLHSGVTSWTTHEKQAPKTENGRLESQMIGSNYKANQKSLSFFEEMMK
jgi:hypothetical protein